MIRNYTYFIYLIEIILYFLHYHTHMIINAQEGFVNTYENPLLFINDDAFKFYTKEHETVEK